MKFSKPLVIWLIGTALAVLLVSAFAFRPQPRVVMDETKAPKPKSRQDVVVIVKDSKEISSFASGAGSEAMLAPQGKKLMRCTLAITNKSKDTLVLNPNDFILSTKDKKWFFSHSIVPTSGDGVIANAPPAIMPGATTEHTVVFSAGPSSIPDRVYCIDRRPPGTCATCPIPKQ